MTPSNVLWTAAEAVSATGGSCHSDWQAFGVSIDSRSLAGGDLFVALKGPNFDGHDFVAAAFDRGATAAMVSRTPAGLPPSLPFLVVADVEQGLTALGRAARARNQGRIIAVTGSVGKTGVKEALRLVLSAEAQVAASEANLNNQWGVPLSLARLPAEVRYAVLELGMNHAGELTPLSKLVRPHVAVITAIEAVHKAFFASVEAIADAKAEILVGVEPCGVAVLNRDNPYFHRLAAAAGRVGIPTIVSFGRHPDAGVRLLAETTEAGGSWVRARVGDETVEYRLNVAGAHWVMNSLCVLAAAASAGADVHSVARALPSFQVPKGRGRRHTVAIAGGAVEVIDDSYNASPVSVGAALSVLGRQTPNNGGRRIAVLGDMLELGDEAPLLHSGLAAPIVDNNIDLVFTAGPLMAHLDAALPAERRAAHAADSVRLATEVTSAVRPGDIVVVKGSAGSRMGAVVAALLSMSIAGRE